MKIKMTARACGPDGSFQRGQVYGDGEDDQPIDPQVAARFVAAGAAELVEGELPDLPEVNEEKTETATKGRKKRKRES